MGIRLKDLSKLGYRDNVARSLAVAIVGKHCKHQSKEQIIKTLSDVLENVGSTRDAIPHFCGWFPRVCPRTVRTCLHVYGSPLVSTLLFGFFDFHKTFFAYRYGFTIHKKHLLAPWRISLN